MKEWSDKYNAFNSLKILKHVNKWSQILSHDIPPPISVSIDPFSGCNLNCSYCNAKYALDHVNGGMSIETVDKMCNQLKKWNTKAACIAGGGEPTLYKDFDYLVNKLYDSGVKCGVITNGTNLIKNKDPLYRCEWVGVSLDAGSADVFSALKGVDPKIFDKIVDNIKEYSAGRSKELTIKYLVHPLNYKDIYNACEVAYDLGVDLIQIRPGGESWFNLNGNQFMFTDKMVEEVNEQIDEAREDFENKDFKVYGVMHKFNKDFSAKKSFKKCWATYVTCYFIPNGMVGLCCDRRGDNKLELCHVDDLDKVWGSKKHIDMVNAIKISECPRCTLCCVNEVFENVIINDKMYCEFI